MACFCSEMSNTTKYYPRTDYFESKETKWKEWIANEGAATRCILWEHQTK